MIHAQEMLAAFEGSRAAHGTTHVGRVGRNGKADADSRIVREPLTNDKIQAHLEGKQGVGAIPINDKNECRWGALDIDVYDLDHASLQQKIQKLKLPLVHCRSKSGGAHLFLFLTHYEQASVVREYLLEMAVALGHSGSEIFPKQDKILSERGDVGNFINLPYYDNGNSNRYAVDKNNSKLSVEAFIKFANESKIDKETLDKLVEETHSNILVGTNKEFDDGPPCLALCSKTKLDDGRDRFMYNYMVFAKKKYKDKWPDFVAKANYNYLEDPWDKTKLDSKISAWRKDTAGHTCYEDPIHSKCMRSLCYSRPFGVK